MHRTLIPLALVPLALGLASLECGAAGPIEHVEPPFWWTGMQSGRLELLVHGDDIARLEPEIGNEGRAHVAIVNVHRTDNPNYLFIELNVASEAKAGSFRIDFMDANSAVLQHDYELRARAAGSAGRHGFDASDVIYLITPDRFANGDPANDELPEFADGLDRDDPYGRHGGDLAGIIGRLDYIADMGYTQIWLNPVLENAQPEASYHGYATTDYYRVDPRFGSNALYRQLAEEARKRGIGLIMDMIPNHCGSGHWWMDDLPADDWINHDARFVGTTHDRTSLFDPHGAASDRARFSDGWFVPAMPDLNQRNPRLAAYLVQNAIWWVEFAGLSGIRVDTWPYSDKAFLTEWARRLAAEYPNLNIVGEEWITNPAMVAYWQRDTPRRDGYASYLPSLMDFPLHDAVMTGLREETGGGNGLERIYRMLANDFLYGAPDNLVVFPGNHDMSRVYTQLEERFDLYRIALVFFLTTRGIPHLYYGDEILLTNPGTDSHGVIRGDFPGGWPGDTVDAFSGEGLTDRQREAQQLTRRLLGWRKSATAVHDGKLTQYAPEDGTYTYFRHDDRRTVMVVINNSPAARRIEPGRFTDVLTGSEAGSDILGGGHYRMDAPFEVAAHSVLLLDLGRAR